MASSEVCERREEVLRIGAVPCYFLAYPTHEKEMLVIVRALRRFRADLLGTHFTVYTDHRTLECFQGQRGLSRQVKGEENTVADVLSQCHRVGRSDPPAYIFHHDHRQNGWEPHRLAQRPVLQP